MWDEETGWLLLLPLLSMWELRCDGVVRCDNDEKEDEDEEDERSLDGLRRRSVKLLGGELGEWRWGRAWRSWRWRKRWRKEEGAVRKQSGSRSRGSRCMRSRWWGRWWRGWRARRNSTPQQREWCWGSQQLQQQDPNWDSHCCHDATLHRSSSSSWMMENDGSSEDLDFAVVHQDCLPENAIVAEAERKKKKETRMMKEKKKQQEQKKSEARKELAHPHTTAAESMNRIGNVWYWTWLTQNDGDVRWRAAAHQTDRLHHWRRTPTAQLRRKRLSPVAHNTCHGRESNVGKDNRPERSKDQEGMKTANTEENGRKKAGR